MMTAVIPPSTKKKRKKLPARPVDDTEITEDLWDWMNT